MTAVPKGFSAPARKMWKDIVASHELRSDELRLLEEACREVTLIERLEAELVSGPLTVSGSMGQPVANPLVQEIRQHRSALRGLLGSLKLSDADDGSSSRSASAREAAAARWRRVS